MSAQQPVIDLRAAMDAQRYGSAEWFIAERLFYAAKRALDAENHASHQAQRAIAIAQHCTAKCYRCGAPAVPRALPMCSACDRLPPPSLEND